LVINTQKFFFVTPSSCQYLSINIENDLKQKLTTSTLDIELVLNTRIDAVIALLIGMAI